METIILIGFACAICGFAAGLLLICLDHDWGIAITAVGMVLGIVLAIVGGASL